MAGVKTSNYNIVVGVDFVQGDVQKKLDEIQSKLKPLALKIDMADVKAQADEISKSLDNVTDGTKNADDAAKDLGISYQAANAILRTTTDIIESMVDQVYELDSAMTEFKKVSTLDGQGLEDYKQQLAEIGKTVARTGKPKCQARNIGIVNQY